MPLAYHVRAACSNLFNGKADVPNCDALASVDSPSLIYVRLIECLFCLPFPPFWPMLLVRLVSVSFSRFGFFANVPPCSAPRPPLAPSLPTRSLPVILLSLAVHLSCLQPNFKTPNPEYRKSRARANVISKGLLSIYTGSIDMNVSNTSISAAMTRQKLTIVHVCRYRLPRLPHIIRVPSILPFAPICYLTYHLHTYTTHASHVTYNTCQRAWPPASTCILHPAYPHLYIPSHNNLVQFLHRS
ncbi:hypothetical protein HDV63DRAFT_389302 [Trichoderma sp. SZMC 28014]